MPTFGLKETDLEGDMFEDGSDAYFRRFIAPSMAFLRKKKIFRDHAENIELFNEIEDRKASARDRAYLKFEEARRKHDAKFSNKEQTPSQFASSHISDKEQENIIESWRRVSIHPSSTASINVHGVVGQSMLCENESEAAPSTSNALLPGVLSESTTNLNSSIPSHLYDSSHDASSFFNTRNPAYPVDRECCRKMGFKYLMDDKEDVSRIRRASLKKDNRNGCFHAVWNLCLNA